MSSALSVSGPLTAGAIVSRTFRVYGTHFGRFVLVSAIFLVPAHALFLVLSTGLPAFYAVLALMALAMLPIASLALRATTGGQAPGLKDAFQLALRRAPTYAGVMIWQWLLMVVINVPGVTLRLIATPTAGWRGIAGFQCLGVPLNLAGLLLCLYIGLRWSVTTPATLAECAGVINVIKRSWSLTRRHTSHCLAIWLFIGLMLALTYAPTALTAQWFGFTTVYKVVWAATHIVVWPVAGIAPVLLYLDLSARQVSPAGTGVEQVASPDMSIEA